MLKIILTSFRDRHRWEGAKYSVARWNPSDARTIPRLEYLAPVWAGQPMRHLTPEEFRTKYELILERVSPKFLEFIKEFDGKELVLLCWCNPTRQRGYSKLYCHRILIGYEVEKQLPAVEVVYADGAENPIWERNT